jgi:hypothetical protein
MSEGIARGNVVASHACVISREGCRVLVETPYSGVPVDVMFKQTSSNNASTPYCIGSTRQRWLEATLKKRN